MADDVPRDPGRCCDEEGVWVVDENLVGEQIDCPMRVRSRDYGIGTVIAILGDRILVVYDNPIAGTETRQLDHARRYVAEMERL